MRYSYNEFPSKEHRLHSVFERADETTADRVVFDRPRSESIRKRRFNLSYFSTLVAREAEMVRYTREKLGIRECVYIYILVRSTSSSRVIGGMVTGRWLTLNAVHSSRERGGRFRGEKNGKIASPFETV